MQGLDKYRMFHTQEVVGSSPTATTIKLRHQQSFTRVIRENVLCDASSVL